MEANSSLEARQKESGRRPFLLAALALVWSAVPARAEPDLDAGGLTFKDFAVSDNGTSFNQVNPMIGSGAQPTQSKGLHIDGPGGFARIRFDSIRTEVAMPLGWQAQEDWERGIGFSADKRYRVIVWRVDFAFEGVNDAEHYAATKAGAIQARKPGVKAQARKLPDGTFLVVYENVAKAQGDSETRVVFDLIRQRPDNPKEGVLLTLGAPVSDSARGLSLLALISQNMKINW